MPETNGYRPPLLEEDFSKLPQYRPQRGSKWVAAAVLALVAGVYLMNAGAFGLWDCWETHYGEVARNMFETSDYLGPWWGYREKIGTEPAGGAPFFSKPILIFWTENIAMNTFGFGEWSIRLPMELLGIFSVFLIFLTFLRIFSRKIGLLAAGMVMTSPMFFFIARQAITDMPFVGTLTIGLMLFINAYFGPAYKPSKRRLMTYMALTVGTFLLVAVPQYVILALDLYPEGSFSNLGPLMRIWFLFQKTGIAHTIIYSIVAIGVLAWILIPFIKGLKRGMDDREKDMWVRRMLLYIAYIFLGLATLGKGLLGIMLPGAFVFFYLWLTGEWKALKKLEIVRGGLVWLLVTLPWYLGMMARYGMAFYNRFFVHDHFNRLGAGVHQIDTGTFEYYMKWLGIGTFPWVAFVPLVIFGLSRLKLSKADYKDRLKLFLMIWAFFSYTLFALAATVFHHYIFPALPPLIILIAIFLDEYVLSTRHWLAKATIILAIGFVAAAGQNISSDVQDFRNMCTYKYDRALPRHPPIDPNAKVDTGATKTWKNSTFYSEINPMLRTLLTRPYLKYHKFFPVLVGLMILALLLMLWPRIRTWAFGGLFILGLVMSLWVLNYYMPMLTPSWSQKYLYDDYYKRCERLPNPPEIEEAYTPLIKKIGLTGLYNYLGMRTKQVCKEDIVTWLITWRGETFYTYNEIKPLMKSKQMLPYLRDINKGKTFFAMVQAHGSGGFRSALNRESSKLTKEKADGFRDITTWKVDVVHQESAYFNLLKATPVKNTNKKKK